MRFSPEVTQQFARLEAMVHDSNQFAPEILSELQDRAAGKPISVKNTIMSVAVIVRETMKHVAATGNTRAKEQLGDLVSELIGGPSSHPVALTGPKAAVRTRS